MNNKHSNLLLLLPVAIVLLMNIALFHYALNAPTMPERYLMLAGTTLGIVASVWMAVYVWRNRARNSSDSYEH